MHREGHILVFEPDDSIRELLERWLGERGYPVVIGDCENLVPGDAPLLVIVNISSPRGAETLVPSLQAVYPAPILVVSARFRRGLGASTDVALQLGVRKVLPKPFTREELLCAVDESIKGPQ